MDAMKTYLTSCCCGVTCGDAHSVTSRKGCQVKKKKEATYRSSVTLTQSEREKLHKFLDKKELSVNEFLRSKVLEVITR